MRPSDRVRQVLGVKPHDYQVPFLDSEATYLVATGGRRSGKTMMAMLSCLDTALTVADCDVLVFPANENKGREAIGEMVRILDRAGLRSRMALDPTSMMIEFPGNWSRVRALPPTAGQGRGEGARTMKVWIDEAGMQRSSLWSDLRYVLMDNQARGAQAILTGTPWGARTHFFYDSYRRGLDGDPDYKSFTWPTELNPKVSKAWLERERARLNSMEAASELDGEWVDAAGAFLSHELIERNVADVELAAWEDMAGPARMALGIDFGVKFDLSAAVAVGRLPVWRFNPDRPPVPVFGVVGLKVWPAGTELHRVVGEVVSGNAARWSVVCPEENGAGAQPSQDVRRLMAARSDEEDWPVYLRPVATSARTKQHGYGLIRSLLERGQLVLPRDPDLLRQLGNLRYDISDFGSMRIEAENARIHDDVVDALYLATGPRVKDGRVSSWLGGCLENFGPDADVPEDTELVATGGGLRVPRRPWVQSVDGDELTPGSRVASVKERAVAEQAEWLAQTRRQVAEVINRAQNERNTRRWTTRIR